MVCRGENRVKKNGQNEEDRLSSIFQAVKFLDRELDRKQRRVLAVPLLFSCFRLFCVIILYPFRTEIEREIKILLRKEYRKI